MTYGLQMAIEGFFSAPSVPEDKIGGWYVQGHDADDNYQDFVVTGADNWQEIFARTTGWHDWFKAPLEIGNPLIAKENISGQAS